MSSMASTYPGGPGFSAWHYRDTFLREGHCPDLFYCPYCEVRICAVLIDTLDELPRSPGFKTVQNWGNHLQGCDGDPKSSNKPPKPPSNIHKELAKLAEDAPIELIERPVHRKSQHTTTSSTHKPSPEEIEQRRLRSGLKGESKPKTYLLQSLVERWLTTKHVAYTLANENDWDAKTRNEHIKQTLESMPIKLSDQTNFNQAFRKPAYYWYSQSRIYHESGLIIQNSEGFTITVQFNKKHVDKATDLISYSEQQMVVNIPLSLFTDDSPQSHKKLLKNLTAAATNLKKHYWYAYGLPVQNKGDLSLLVQNLDHFYIRF